jgi:hypothetical protein
MIFLVVLVILQFHSCIFSSVGIVHHFLIKDTVKENLEVVINK